MEGVEVPSRRVSQAQVAACAADVSESERRAKSKRKSIIIGDTLVSYVSPRFITYITRRWEITGINR